MDAPHVDTGMSSPTGLRVVLVAMLVLATAGALAAAFTARDGVIVAAGIGSMLVAVLAVIGLVCTRRTRRIAMPALTAVAGGALPASDAQRELESLRAMQRELLAAKQAAEAATMAKGEFLATMSHEIRTPLNGIVPLLDLMLSTPLQADQREYMNTAHQSAHELLRIVDDILDYSKLEASKLELESVGVNIRDLVGSVANLMEGSASAKGLRLAVSIDPSVRLAVRGDPVRLRQVLTNLVSNAIKFTERGSVTIQIGKRGESRTHYEIVFAVRDTGIGLSTEAAAKLFLPFSQADASTTRLYGGTGLGLVICKRLVDLMGGKIGVRSEVGRGSLFWFNVPLQKAVGDIRVRRDLNGARALVLGTDEAFVRRTAGLLANLGVSHVHTALAVDALTRLRGSASMSERWGYEILIIDTESVRAAAVPLVRNVLRDPALDHMRILVSGADESTQDLSDTARTSSLPAAFDERELRAALHALLDIDDAPPGREAPLLGTEAAPDSDPDPSEASTQLSGHVLLVEDNAVNLQVARRLLTLLGLRVDAAEHGQAALDQLARTRYDLVLMDCQMPIMDGYTATRSRRASEAERGLPHLPIIAMTANAMVGDREKCLAAGMDDYLTKPLDRRLLEKTLARWLSAPSRTVSARPQQATTQADAATGNPAAIEMPAASAAIDESVVRELVDVMGDEFSALVRVYLEDVPRLIGSLRGAALRGDVDTFGASAHSLKSSSANLGALPLAELARRAEHDVRAGNAIDLDATAAAIELEFQRAAGTLQALGLAPA